MNKKLKHAIITSGKPSWRIAQAVGIHETVLSRIVAERREPSSAEQENISKALGMPVSVLFGDEPLPPQTNEDRFKTSIYDRVIEVLSDEFTKEEWIELGEQMDIDSRDGLLDKVNEKIETITPEAFDPPTTVARKRLRAQ